MRPAPGRRGRAAGTAPGVLGASRESAVLPPSLQSLLAGYRSCCFLLGARLGLRLAAAPSERGSAKRAPVGCRREEETFAFLLRAPQAAASQVSAARCAEPESTQCL